jgi:hypothetical protein
MAQYGPSQNRNDFQGGEVQVQGQGEGQGYLDQSTFDLSYFTQTNNPYDPDLSLDQLPPLEHGHDFESYPNFNFDAHVRPQDDLADLVALASSSTDLASDLEAQIQAALRPIDPSTYNSLTLAPSVSLSPSSQGSPYSDRSHGWFSEMTEEEVESMELLKVYLDEMGMGLTGVGLEEGSPIEKYLALDQGQGMMMEEMGQGSRSESPETVASIALHSQCGSSGRQSPSISTSDSGSGTSFNLGEAGPSTITPNSMIDPRSLSLPTSLPNSTSTSITSTPSEEGLSFMFDFEQVSTHPVQQEQGMDTRMEMDMSGEKWMMGVLPFDMADQVMGTA